MAKHLKSQLLVIRWVKVALISSLLSAVILCWLISSLVQMHLYHQHLNSNTRLETSLFNSHQTPKALFLNAFIHNNQGQHEKALADYANVVSSVSKENPLIAAAYFNSGNTYLKMAMERLEQEGLPGWDVAGPLVALAKESYQKALRIRPQWSEAKYNYQLALRLAPTSHGMRGPQQYEDENIKQEEKPSGWPAMPGNPRGMP